MGRSCLVFEAVPGADEPREVGALPAYRLFVPRETLLARDKLGRVYAAMGREFPPPLQRAVLEYLARRPQGQHGPHRYDAASFGLDPQEIRDGLAPYVERFGVESETG